jgi:imidazolonepropionase
VLIEGETIRDVGLASELESRYSGQGLEHIVANCVVMPAFVDSHAHLVFVSSRDNEYERRIQGATYQEIAEQDGGIVSSVRALRSGSKDELLQRSEVRVRRAMEYGTTTLEAKSGYGLDLENETKILEVIQELQQRLPLELVPTFLGAHEIPPEYRSQKSAYIDLLVDEMIPTIARRQLAEFCDCFVEPHLFSIGCRADRRAALRHGLRIKLHADQLTRQGATQLGVRLGATRRPHSSKSTQKTFRRWRARKPWLLCCQARVSLGLSRYPPARALIDARCPVALATDFNPDLLPPSACR